MPDLPDDLRTTDLFERVGTYRQPPLIAFPRLSDPSILRRFGVHPGLVANSILQPAFALSGLRRFARSSPAEIEEILRRTETRILAFPPVISATIVLRDDPRAPSTAQRAATLVLGARSLNPDVASGALSQDEHKGQPLDMGQYPNLFSTSLDVDGARFRVRKTRDTSTIAIACREELHTFSPWARGESPGVPELALALEQVAAESAARPASAREPAVGLLTAAHDETQFHAFARLAADAGNRASLDALRNVCLTLCLEPDVHPESAGETVLLAHSRHFANRWSHSSLQIVVFGNGVAAAVCSFRAWLDGNAMVRGAAEIQRRGGTLALERRAGASTVSISPATRLKWQVERRLIDEAAADVQGVLDDNPSGSLQIDGIGRDTVGVSGFAPVPVFVVSLAWAVRRLTGRVPAIRQFLSLATHGCMGVTSATVTTPAVERSVAYLELGSPDRATALGLLGDAARSQESECSEVRDTLQLEDLRHLFHQTQPETQRKFSTRIEHTALSLLAKLKMREEQPRDILISHPTLRPEVVAVGRPGVRLPFVGLFAMHYALESDRITATIGRGVCSKMPNAQLAAGIGLAVRSVAALLASGA